MKYRKKPVVIDAIEWDGFDHTLRNIRRMAPAGKRAVKLAPGGGIAIVTLEGEMRANIGDFVIRGIRGELYPCKPDIFHATYDRVQDDRDVGAAEVRDDELREIEDEILADEEGVTS